MAKVKDFAHQVDTIAANSFLDAMQEWFSTFASFFRIELATATSIRIPAGTGNDQVGIGIAKDATLGLWRYRSTTITAAHPGGAAGPYDVYVTASGPNVTPPDTDNTDYNFGLEIRAVGSPPSTFAYRKVGSVSWDGTKVTGIEQIVGTVGVPGGMPSGAITQYAGGTAPSGWLLCDGSAFDPVVYPSLNAVIGNSYGGTVANPLLPDMRGRVAVGRDATQSEFDTLNKKGGVKTHALAITEMPGHDHGGGAHAHTLVAAGTGIGIYAAGTGIGIIAANIDHRHWLNWNRITTGNFAGSPGNNVVTGLVDWPVAGYTSTISSYAQEGNQNHAHGVSDPTHAHSISDPGHTHGVNTSAPTITSQGGGQAHPNLQPYITLNHIIKT